MPQATGIHQVARQLDRVHGIAVTPGGDLGKRLGMVRLDGLRLHVPWMPWMPW